MLSQSEIERITFEAMKKYSREHKGETGWTKEGITNGVLAAGGEQSDVWRSMALGMNLCGIKGYQCGQEPQN